MTLDFTVIGEMVGVRDLIEQNPSLSFTYDYDEDLGGVLLGVRRGVVRCERLIEDVRVEQIRPDLSEFQVVECYKGLIYDIGGY